MRLLIDGTWEDVRATSETTFVSRHTGMELRRLSVELHVRGEEAERRVREALDGGHLTVASDDGQVELTCSAQDGGYRSQQVEDEPADYVHEIELEELEELVASEVRFADVALTPVTYEEADDADCLHVSLTAVITPELRDRLFALKRGRGYFSVIRVGVNEAPEEMRLGRLLWSREGDLVRQEVNLVDRRWDEVHGGPLSGLARMHEPFRTRAEEQIILGEAMLERLLAALAAGGILSQEQLAAIHTPDERELECREPEFSRVDDLEKHLRLE